MERKTVKGGFWQVGTTGNKTTYTGLSSEDPHAVGTNTPTQKPPKACDIGHSSS